MVKGKKELLIERVLSETKPLSDGEKQEYYWEKISLKELESIIDDIPREEQVWAYSGLSLQRPLSKIEYDKYISLFKDLLKKKHMPEPSYLKNFGILAVFFAGITAFLTMIGKNFTQSK